MDQAASLLEDGLRFILKVFSPSPLLKWSSILPTEILSQISLKLINDLTEEHLDITTVYSEYIQKLCINRTLANEVIIPTENQVIDSGHGVTTPTRENRAIAPRNGVTTPTRGNRVTDPGHGVTTPTRENRATDPGHGISFTDGPTLTTQGLIQSMGTSETRVRAQNYPRQIPEASEGSWLNQNKTQTRKDTQEQAIYAFTIVTIIFLPLSTVAGIFGMNTTDIRDIEYGQWLYWATAVPVTALVILGGLWWMGELGNAVLWLLNVRRPSQKDLRNVERFESRTESSEDDLPPPHVYREYRERMLRRGV
ncbi:hypothetical protein GCG54_00005678 [Colletotrichum gloeosporioides]|uniref:Uncharacterized protein n=1 Tax=Colletotrichum gloeosporioides TaxID=474922 RepID=A0A8H4FLT3_COLGL|nr:uncharacterized protein GCG54_00005678 [Colletotrichum gloeosporioides]KAF3805639.1 hypothetical protein GCG54_00005678 [Colletotrichum gloeosporioides]